MISLEKKKNIEVWSDVKLEDELGYKDTLPKEVKDKLFLEDWAIGLLGESQGCDIMLTANCFDIGGSVWGVKEAVCQQTCLLILPQDKRGKIHDNDFITSALDPRCSYDFKIIKEPDRVIWKAGNREYISRPPYWEIRGEHNGVGLDLVLSGMGKADWFLGPWENLDKQGFAGRDQACRAEGTITVGGTKYTLEKAYATQEHVITSLVSLLDTPRIRGPKPPYYWGIRIDDQIRMVAYSESGMGFARLSIDGQEVIYTGDQIAVNELDWWVDPRTGMKVPTRWHLNMNSEGGVLDMVLQSYGRLVYWYVGHRTIRFFCPFCCRSKGRFFHSNGRSILIEDGIHWIECGWTMDLHTAA